MSIQSIKIKNGVNLHYIHTGKFKTTTLGIYFHRPLRREEAAMNALAANVIKRGCPLFPESQKLSRRLESLYGASLVTGVRKKGDSQIIHVNFEFVNERFVPGEQSVFGSVFELAKSVVFGQEGFSPEHTAQEKENLKQQIMAQINDKRTYAANRCKEIMCADEPYGISELGFVEDVDFTDAVNLFYHYKNAVLKSPVDIFICGDADISAAERLVRDMAVGIEAEGVYPETTVVTTVGEVKSVTETEQINQGKLSMGFRTKVMPGGERYPALLVFNAVFGGGSSSKLFNNVREKLSLAYYANSRIDMFKGIMTVNSGIEVENFQKAYDEILLQLDEVKNGNITDDEMSAAILSTVTNIKSMTDSAPIMEDYWLGRLISGISSGFGDVTRMVQGVTKDEVIAAAQDVELDTVYFLKGVQS